VCCRSGNNLKSSQEAYIKRILEQFRMYNKPIDTPYEKGLTLSLDQWPKTNDGIKKINNDSYVSVARS